MQTQFSDDGPKSVNFGQMASLCICMSSFKEVISQSQKTGDGLSTLSLTCCVILGKPLSLNILICKMVITLSSQVCSLDTIHLHYYMLWNGSKISREKRPRGPFHSQLGLTSPELPVHQPLRSLCNLLQKGELVLEHCATRLVSSALPWLQQLNL